MVTHCDRYGIKFDAGGRGIAEITNRRKNINYLLLPPPPSRLLIYRVGLQALISSICTFSDLQYLYFF
jgi:hypothetical protein